MTQSIATPKKRSNAVVTMTEAGTDDKPTLLFTVLGAGALELDLTTLSEEVKTRALIHGLKQRISDAAAIPCNPETGKPASPEDKFAAMELLIRHYNSGATEWNRVRAAGGERTPNGGKILTAIATVYGFTIEKARLVVEGTAKKQGVEYKAALTIWKNTDKIAAELARMASADSPVDADELLAELDD